MLSGCLESVAGLVDEIVVVDTGSGDSTIEIALAHGARVLETRWTDDFSAARNAAIDVTLSDYILFLDADERLEPESQRAVREIVAAEPEDAPPTIYAPLILNVDAVGMSLGADHMPRLFRRQPDLRFAGRIHESLGRDLPGLRTVFEDRIRIVHLGYDPAYARNRGKNERNVRLLEQELAERPDDPTLIFYRAKEHYAAGEDAVAAEWFQRVIKLKPSLSFACSSYVFGVECLRSTGKAEDALKLGLEGAQINPDYGELWFALGMAALDCGRPVQAEGMFLQAMKVTQGFALTAFQDPDIRVWRAEVARGQALQLQSNDKGAIEAWLAARPKVPLGRNRVRVDLDLIEAYLRLGKQQEAWQLLEPMLDTATEDAVGPLLEFVELYLEYVGPEDAWRFFQDTAAVHANILRQLPLVACGVELAELLNDHERLFELLNIAVHLGTQVPAHYDLLARHLDARGQSSAAEAARRALHRLLAD